LCGPSVERLSKVDGDWIYDIEVTTNRVDMMSVTGIAREAAAILPEFGVKAELVPLTLPPIASYKSLDIKIINNPQLCQRILAIKLGGVKIGPSPEWLQKRLIQVGQRPLNNVIDITNYVMWEVGHPVHVFDYDRLTKKTIAVREAKKGERLKTLDDKVHRLVGGEVVFDDGTGTIIDLPGIMGTANTVVTDKTTNILLWIESIDPVKIRQASMTLAIRSQAAVLNEKQVDPELGLMAVLRVVELCQKLTQAKVASKLVDIYPVKPVIKPITLTDERLTTYLGLRVEPERVKGILERLGCQIQVKNENLKVKNNKKGGDEETINYEVVPPTWRARDLTIPEDLIEEVARIYGYHNFPSSVMATTIPDAPSEENFRLEYQIKQWLTGWGFTEIYTYSMVAKDLVLASGYPLASHLKIKNPLSDEWVYMRRSLVPSIMAVVESNQRDMIRVFEMQNVFHPAGKRSELPNEELQLVVATTTSYQELKGVVDGLMTKLFLANELYVVPTNVDQDGFGVGQTGEIVVGKKRLGVMGQLKAKKMWVAKILMRELMALARTHPRYIPIKTTPPIREDLTFQVPDKTYLGNLLLTVAKTSKLVETAIISKRYKPPTATDSTNITLTLTYRDPKKSLTDKELMPVRKKIATSLAQLYSAQLVGLLE